MTIPATHLDQAFQLEMDQIVKLYKLTLRKTGTIVYFRNGPEITWQGNLYNNWPCSLEGDGFNADGESKRPTLTIYNPEGALTPTEEQGEFDLAILVVKEVLQDHLLANVNIFKQRTWFISKALDVSRSSISLQCHTTVDVPNFAVPGRFFSPNYGFPFLVY